MQNSRLAALEATVLTGQLTVVGTRQTAEPNPSLTKYDLERLSAAQEKRKRRALKRTKILKNGVHGTKLQEGT